MLRDTSALDEWLRRERPPGWVQLAVRDWIEGLAAAPWRFPSVPIAELSDQAVTEVRQATVPDTRVVVLYRVTFASDVVDLIAVMPAVD